MADGWLIPVAPPAVDAYTTYAVDDEGVESEMTVGIVWPCKVNRGNEDVTLRVMMNAERVADLLAACMAVIGDGSSS